MTRLLALVIVVAISYATLSAQDVETPGTIVVDASKGGGVWWFPQAKEGFDPSQDHQGKRLADYLKSCGWEVQEIARGEDVTERLKGVDVVIRPGVFGNYQESEVRAYREYVSNGGNLLLLQGFVRDGRASRDKVAKEFGIVFSETVRTPTIRRWAEHPLTTDLALLQYRIGSIVTESPKSTIPIAFLDDDQLVMGIVRIGKGKVIFVSTILPLLQVPQPFMKRVLDELTLRSGTLRARNSRRTQRGARDGLGDSATAGAPPDTVDVAELQELVQKVVDEEGYFYAARKLGRYGEAAAPVVPQLIELLKSDEPRIQASTVEALGMIGSPAKAAVPLLVEILKDGRTPWYLFVGAAKALPNMQPESRVAIPVLIEFITRTEVTPLPGDNRLTGVNHRTCEVAAIGSLAMFGPHASDAVPAILRKLREDEPIPPMPPGRGEAHGLVASLSAIPYRRSAAAWALGRIAPGDEQVIAVLVVFVRDSSLTGRNIFIREAAMYALGEMGANAKSAVPVLREYLSKERHEPNSRLERAAKDALQKIDPSLKPTDSSSPQLPAHLGCAQVEISFEGK